jgi:hypothetical protein
MNVKVEETERLYLLNSSSVSSNKEVSLSHLDDTDDSVALGSNVKPIVAAK